MIRNLPAKSALALIALATLAAHAAAQAPQSASVGSLPAQGAPARAARHPPTSHPAATAWTRQQAPDCTSTVELPDGWRFVDGDAPGVWIQGPGNETLVLGSRKFMKPGEADYMLPEQALAWFARNRGVELQGIQSLQPLKITFAGEYETMVAQAESGGQKLKLVASVETEQMGKEGWFFQLSLLSAPIEQFDAATPTMLRIYNSLKSVQDGVLPSHDGSQIRTPAACKIYGGPHDYEDPIRDEILREERLRDE
jgi:hypothetical protein